MADPALEFPPVHEETEKYARFALKWLQDRSAAAVEHHGWNDALPIANAIGALRSLLGFYLAHRAAQPVTAPLHPFPLNGAEPAPADALADELDAWAQGFSDDRAFPGGRPAGVNHDLIVSREALLRRAAAALRARHAAEPAVTREQIEQIVREAFVTTDFEDNARVAADAVLALFRAPEAKQ